jgi:hypothetical protein
MAKAKVKEPVFTLTSVLIGGAVIGGVTLFLLRTRPAHAAVLSPHIEPHAEPRLVITNTSRTTGDFRVGDVLAVRVEPPMALIVTAHRPDDAEASITCQAGVTCAVTVDATGAWSLRATTLEGASVGTAMGVTVLPRLALVRNPAEAEVTDRFAVNGGPGVTNLGLTGVQQLFTSLSPEGTTAFSVNYPVVVHRVATGGTAPRYSTTVWTPQDTILRVSPWEPASDFRFTPNSVGIWKIVSRATEGAVNVSSAEQQFEVLSY